MASLIQFLEAARTIWRWVVLVAACAAIYSAFQYKYQSSNIFSREGMVSVIRVAKGRTSSQFLNSTLDRLERIIEGDDDGESVGGAVRAVGRNSSRTPSEPSPERAPVGRQVAARTQAPGTGSTRAGTDGGPATTNAPRVETQTAARESDHERAAAIDQNGPQVRLAFRRFASQFCRATRSVAEYYTERVTAMNGSPSLRVGSGVRFPSIERLTTGSEQTLAEKELEVRLRCDYELAYGSGERADPNRPRFEQWREATLERRYGEMWTRIDLTRIPTPEDPMSRGEWYVVTPASQE